MTFEAEAEAAGDNEALEAIEHLVDTLRHYVRGRITSTLTEYLSQQEVIRGNNHRRAESYLKDWEGDFNHIYNSLGLEERIFTRPFWQIVKELQFNTSCSSNLIYDYQAMEFRHDKNLQLAQEMGIANVNLTAVKIASGKLNDIMHKRRVGNKSHNGIVPSPSLPEPQQEWSPLTNRLLGPLDAAAARFSLPLRTKAESFTIAQAPTLESCLPIRTKPESFTADDMTAPESPTLGLFHKGDTSSLSPLITDNASSRAVYSPLFIDPKRDEGYYFQLPSSDNPALSASFPYFCPSTFLRNVHEHVYSICSAMLSAEQLDYNHVTDTIVSLTDAEFKYLPLWAGGTDDGSGGVFEVAVPPTDMGPNGPGPVFHTGYSIASSRASSVVDVGSDAGTDSGVGTSVRVENGYSDHVDRRIVMSDFGSEDGEADDEEADFSGGEEESWDGDMKI